MTSEQAEEKYAYYKRKYSQAANELRSSERAEEQYTAEKRAASSQITSLSCEKMNLEKRLEGLENIIRMLEGKTDGFFSVNIPHAIEKVTSALTKTDESYRQSIRLIDGVPAASLERAFHTKSVEGDSHSASALAEYRNEREKLIQTIASLKAQIDSLNDLVTSLTGKIRVCNDTQISLRSAMNSYSYDMSRCRKYMYAD